MLCRKFGPRYWLSFTTTGFGLVTIGMAFVSSLPAMLIYRMLLGVFESGVQPGIIYTYSQYYRRHELISRLGIEAAGAYIAGSFGGLLACGLGELPKVGVLERWRWIFFVEGFITLIIAAWVVWTLPTDISSVKFLDEGDRTVAMERIAMENMTNGQESMDFESFKKALWNINTQLVGFGLGCSLCVTTALGLFMQSLLSTVGFNMVQSQLLALPLYFVSACICIGVGFLSDRLKTRGFLMLILSFLVVIGFGILANVSTFGVQYFAIFLATNGAFTCSPIIIGWLVSNSTGPAVNAILTGYTVGMGNFGAIIATWTYNWGLDKIWCWCYHVRGNCAHNLYLKWENAARAAGKLNFRLEGQTSTAVDRLEHLHLSYRYDV